MADIIKTWPSVVPARTVARIFSPTVPAFHWYYFTLGRGKPKQAIERLWFTYLGRILGSFEVQEIVCNDGTLPKLNRLDGAKSEWQIAKDAWVAVCPAPITRLRERVFMSSFRGYRYFNFQQYRGTTEARHRI